METPVLSLRNDSESNAPQLEVVVPLLNEAEIISVLHARISQACNLTGFTWRVIYVDDGSEDETSQLLEELIQQDEPVELVRLSRNFGQPAAIVAGLSRSVARRVVLMDGDLQDPPELIPKLVAMADDGNDVVIARRTARQESSRTRRWMFTTFHRLFQSLSDIDIPTNCGTYCLMSRRAVQEILQMPESHRFFPGLRSWVGFRQGFVDFERPQRIGSEPRQSIGRLFRYAGDALFGFSGRPVLWIGNAAMLCGLFSMGSFIAAVCVWIFSGFSVGVAGGLLGGALAGIASVQLMATAYLAELARRIYDQSKQRPIHVIDQISGTGRIAGGNRKQAKAA